MTIKEGEVEVKKSKGGASGGDAFSKRMNEFSKKIDKKIEKNELTSVGEFDID